jgi:hypothetical protein
MHGQQNIKKNREYVEHVCGQLTEGTAAAWGLGLELKHRL